MEEVSFPLYAVEYFGTYISAVWAYENEGLDEHFCTDNDGEEIARFICEEDAKDYFKRNKLGKMLFWDPMDYDPNDPDLGVGYYLIVKYESWTDSGSVIEKSKGNFTQRKIRNLFKNNSGIDLKELVKKHAAG